VQPVTARIARAATANSPCRKFMSYLFFPRHFVQGEVTEH
jgi:hypothetical protein